MSYDPTNKEGFERWATQQGLGLEPVGARMQTRAGVPFPTYFEDATEFAWRGWANRPHRETRMHIADMWPTPKRRAAMSPAFGRRMGSLPQTAAT